MDKRILVATDGSEYSEGAIREAINIAKTCGSQLYAMSVIEINPEFIALAPILMEQLEERMKEHLEGVRSRAVKENVDCEIIIRRGEEPYKLIIEEADKKQAGLIVIGRRGRTGLMRVLMGSVTAKVIGHFKGRILVVPRAASLEWKNILVATDGSKYSDAAIDEAINYAKSYGGTLKIVHVINVMAYFQEQTPALVPSLVEELTNQVKSNLDSIKNKAEQAGVNTETSIEEGTPYKVIVNLAKELNTDIIVMGSHGRTGIQRLLMGSVTERVIGHTGCAVLVVKGKPSS